MGIKGGKEEMKSAGKRESGNNGGGKSGLKNSKPGQSLPQDSTVTHLKGIDNGLTPDNIERFREILLTKRQQLVGDVDTMKDDALNKSRKEASGDLSSMPIHMADIGSDNYEQEFTLGLIESESNLLKEIDEALRRIENGTFGVCPATGKPIGKARLKLKPWAKYSIEHVRQTENNK